MGAWKCNRRRRRNREDDLRQLENAALEMEPLIVKLSDIINNIDYIAHIDKKRVVGEFLHNLGREQHDVDDVKKVIASFPEALLYENEHGAIPIQSAALFTHTKHYISLLAVEASQRNIGLRKGGLLLPSMTNVRKNILQSLVNGYSGKSPAWYEEVCLNALKDLRNAGLLLDEDIIQLNLVKWASGRKSFKRLDYLLDIYPKVLSIPLPSGDFAIHPNNYVGNRKDVDVFERILRAGMDHYPEQYGFLFRRNVFGERAITQAIHNFGKEETLRLIQTIIPSTNEYPILHQVFRYTPELCDDFIDRYPDAIYLKDDKGRNLLHVSVKAGNLKSSSCLLMMIHSAKACIEELDPVTNLYPFMLAAAAESPGQGRKKDLTTIYKLLSLRPDIMSRCLDDDSGL